MYIRHPLSLRQVEDLLSERGIDICHETVRFWWNRFGPMFVAEIRKRCIHHRSFSCRRWQLDEVFVQINGKTHSTRPAVVGSTIGLKTHTNLFDDERGRWRNSGT
jgi:transposase-like protein